MESPRHRFGWRTRIALLATSSIASIVLLEVLIRILMPVYHPSGHVAFTMQDFGAPLAEPNFVGRQWKNTGDYDVEIKINGLGFRDARDVRNANKTD